MSLENLVKKLIVSMALVGVGIFGGVKKGNSEIIGQVIDPNDISTNPAFAIDQNNGLQHLVWGRISPSNLIYANSSDNFATRYVIDDTKEVYGRPDMILDSSGNLHISFSAQVGSWRNYYVNSIDWVVKPLYINNGAAGTVSIALDSSDKLYIAIRSEVSSQDSEIFIAESTDYTTFNYTQIVKDKHQHEPSIDIDSNDIVHLVYYDLSDGMPYKLRYRNSGDNYSSEETLPFSNNDVVTREPDLRVDFFDKIWVAYKETNPLNSKEDVFLARRLNKDVWTSRKINKNSFDAFQGRFPSLDIDSSNNRHIAWSEYNQPLDLVSVLYSNSVKNFNILEVTDSGGAIGKGWSVVRTYGKVPYISANVHSLVNYELPEPISFTPLGLVILTSCLLGLGYRKV